MLLPKPHPQWFWFNLSRVWFAGEDFLNSSSQLWDLESFLNSICVQLFATPWTVAHQAPLSMEFSRQEYRSGYHSLLQRIFPTQVRNPDPGIKPRSPVFQAYSLPSEWPGKPLNPKVEAKTQTNYWYIKIYEGKTQTVYTEASMSIIFGSNQEPLEEDMATHCNILTWEIPWTEEPGGL